MTDDLCRHGDASIEHRRGDLIRVTEDPAFREKIYHCAYRLTGKKEDAEDYSQEAIMRFISFVKNKTTLEEIEKVESRPILPYVYTILGNMHNDKWKKMHRTVQQGKTPDQVDHSQEGASEEQGRQKCTLLAAKMGMPVENIVDCQLEEGQVGSTELGVEEYVVSEITVETFINSLPEELRKLTRLLTFEEYQLNELTGILKLSLGALRRRKKRIREALRCFQEEQLQGRSTNGR